MQIRFRETLSEPLLNMETRVPLLEEENACSEWKALRPFTSDLMVQPPLLVNVKILFFLYFSLPPPSPSLRSSLARL